MKHFLFSFRKGLAFLLACCLACAAYAVPPIKTLIVTGQNNHHWEVSHVAIQKILENSGLFSVDLAISPAAGEDMSAFAPDFSSYSLVVLDYNGAPWSPEANRRFLEFVRRGGGVVVYHAADNSFPAWPAYNQICALGGWENRDENAGPYVYWRDGGLVKDYSAGVGGSHGEQHEYALTARDASHPVVRGLPASWRHAKDELYDRMRGPGNIRTLLYSAYSEPSTGGSGREEPLIFTVDYGKARIFHLMIGHAGESLEDNIAMQCTGFQVLLLRGSEWAATGEVTQPVPADFPTADRVSLRKDYK